MLPVATGDHVIAKHRNGRYYRAVVLSFSDVVYYKVAFDDGTYSNDMYPEDIEASIINLHWHAAKFERFWFQNLCLKKIRDVRWILSEKKNCLNPVACLIHFQDLACFQSFLG